MHKVDHTMHDTTSDFAQLAQSVQALEHTMQEMHVLLEQLLQHEPYITQPDLMVIAEQRPNLAGTHNPGKRPRITCPSDVYDLMKHLSKLEQEELHVLCLNRKNRLIHTQMVFRGTIDSSIIDTRDIFRLALRKCAVSIILTHNHPSGSKQVSTEDIQATKVIVEASKLIGISLLDHLVIGGNDFLSMKEQGLMKEG